MSRTSSVLAMLPFVPSSNMDPNIVSKKPDLNFLIELMTWRRPQNSSSQKGFCRKFLEPVFGKPDAHGNYITVVGDDEPTIAFMAHHDTVHSMAGQQAVLVEGDFIKLPPNSKSNCLGADCTTGVWLILHMISCNVPGRYVIHAAEEDGGLGALAILKDKPDWLYSTQIALSLDRKGTNSIITYQASGRTASDEFAASLSKAIGPEFHFKADPTGTFTDSDVYADLIPECSNLSVGYISQHTSYETQSISHAMSLADALVTCDWKSVLVARNPADKSDRDYWWNNWPNKRNSKYGFRSKFDYDDVDIYWDQKNSQTNRIKDLIKSDPQSAAEAWESLGFDYNDLLDAMYPYGTRSASHW